jgi:hypothetical protein
MKRHSEGDNMVNDSKAETLEKGLYRRAATRWQEVMMLCAEDDDRMGKAAA